MVSRKMAVLLALCAAAFLTTRLWGETPHIVVVLADDMGFGDPQCYNVRSKCPTPHIDALAANGMRFTDAHAAGAWCTPSRYGLLTGRYAFRTSLQWRQQAVIAPDVKTIAHVLQEHGYQTAMVGKWHLGFDDYAADDYSRELRGGPCDRGFATYFGLPASLDIPDYFWIIDRAVPNPPSVRIADSRSQDWSPVQGRFWRGGLRGADFVMQDVLDRIGEEAVKKIDTLARAQHPFFLYVPLTSPHTPWLPAEEYRSSDQAGLYSQFVHHTDAILGRVLASIEQNGITDQTLVVFTSDNGPVWYRSDTERFGHDSMGGLRGMKGDVWEAGHRVPFIVRWPGRIPGSTVCDQLFGFVDLHATLADMAGTQKAKTAVDSMSFADVWLGAEKIPVRSELVCFQEPIAIRSGPWKLINQLGSAGFLAHRTDHGSAFLAKPGEELNPRVGKPDNPAGQLYNLADDLGETQNLWNEKPKLVQQMQSRLAAYTR